MVMARVKMPVWDRAMARGRGFPYLTLAVAYPGFLTVALARDSEVRA